MDLPTWFILATVLLAAVQAGPTDQGPQMFTEDKSTETKQKVHKREPKYEMQMKEVIVYLTPSQIRALASGKGLSQSEIAPVNEQIKEQMQNIYKEEAQKVQREGEHLDGRQEQPAKTKDAKSSKQPKKTKEQQLAPVNNAPQSPQSELQKREKYFDLPPLHFHLTPHLQQHSLSHYEPERTPHALPSAVPYFERQLLQSEAALPQVEPKVAPTVQAVEPHLEKLAISQEKPQWRPQNYAYFYIYPEGKPANTENLELFYPRGAKQWPVVQEEKPKQVLQQSYPELPIFSHHPNFELVPYEYGRQNKNEAQEILQAQLQSHELNAYNLESLNLHAHNIDSHQLEFDAQDLLAHKALEAHYFQYDQARKLEGYQGQTAEKMVEQQVEAGRLKAQNSKNPALQTELKPPKSDDSELDIPELNYRRQMEEVLEARKLKAQLEAQEEEAIRLDAQLEAEQIKAEKMRQEQERLAFLRKLEPKRTQMHSILKPLFQGHNIAESLALQKANFPHSRINLEKGFKPLQSSDLNFDQYAPDYNDEKYRKEVEKILKQNQIAKQKAFEKAAAIANEPPEIIMTKEEDTPKQREPINIVKHVSVPSPVYVPVPEPIEVKVPQPYPVPLEIIRPIPIPIVKTEKVEVEKPVPIEVEKRVPVPVTKNVYIQVDKPYYVEKVVPVEVRKKIPVEIPIRSPQKLSIIRHIWEH